MNTQTYIVIIVAPPGNFWSIGTNTKRGFTQAGAEKAVQKLKEMLPDGFKTWSEELTPIDDILALKQR